MEKVTHVDSINQATGSMARAAGHAIRLAAAGCGQPGESICVTFSASHLFRIR